MRAGSWIGWQVCWIFSLLIPAGAFAAEPVRARKGMVVSSHRLASKAGVEVMQSGGNAVDAAIATGLALAVVHPSAGNIGGGGFMIVHTAGGEVAAFDFREKAPGAAHERLFLDANGKYTGNANHEGYLSVGVPGTVAGFDLALKKFGTKSWKELVAPAVKLAEEGFELSAPLAGAIGRLKKDWDKYPASRRVFLTKDGSILPAGFNWKQPDLARTLQRIRESGRAGFYAGETAALIAADMRRNGGLITEADLAAYEAKERRVIRGKYRGYDIFSMPPPSSGGVALVEMLNMLEGDDLNELGHNSGPYLHLLAEVMRRAFADRAKFLGDPDFNPQLPLERLTSKQHARKLRRSVDDKKASVSDAARFSEAFESSETTHYSVMDAEGNAVVVTYTLEDSYGSRIVADGLGFLYNNEMGDFNPEPGRTDNSGLIGTSPNLVAPGKRMLSSMTPTIVARDGKPVLLTGTPGGRTIINTVFQTVVNVIDFHMNVAEAVEAGRIHHQWLPDRVQFEQEKLSKESVEFLKNRGHAVHPVGRIGEAMLIAVDPKTNERLGAADPRSSDGAAVGY